MSENGESHTMELWCDLSDDEVRERGELLAGEIGAIEDIEALKKEAADEYNAQIKALQAKTSKLAKEVRRRQELRDVEVKEVRVENTRMIQTVRQDTGEVMSEREMTEAERQERLFPDTAAGAEAYMEASESSGDQA